MSVLIKSLTNGTPTVDGSSAAQNDSFNLLQNANTVYNLYSAPNTSPTIRAAIVKGIRLVNTHATTTVKVTVYFNRPNAFGQNRRRLLTPVDMSLPPNFVYVDDTEVTLEPGDRIQAKTDTPNVVQYLLSGVERDAS
jgi:hypothetical protein